MSVVRWMMALGMAAAASTAAAQALWDSGNVPQPHLAKARALAAQSKGWRNPGLGVCYWDDAQPAANMAREEPARKLFDNLYFIGSGQDSVWAIDTPDGIILLDAMSNSKDVDTYVLPGLKAVGLDPARLKMLIISHGHADHFGGAQYLKDRFGVRIIMSAIDWDFSQTQKLRPNQSPPPARDLTVSDGETIRFGGVALKTFISPGHTPGSLSMLIPVTDQGKPRTLLYVSGVSNKNLSPELHAAFDQSYARLIDIAARTKVDGYIAPHASFDDAIYKMEWMRANPIAPNPFLNGTAETLLFLKEVRECNLNSADLHRAMPGRRTPRVGD
ncbi:metallo-beta-lactamase class B [Sphingobium sp. AP50]|uniref:MBL fold metallo-hydrolase n=1 Tax=Sphingobium sp. AP50 TaxID=1884369 RepID=UPI0008D7FF1B|nr:MBL fold metallo-hydrolase [Sphingobium sp. AP50]SEJ74078.1 metallo-beta-lactamase class B [Sphingobium sp. AP50]